MQPMSLPPCRIARSMVRSSPSTQKRRLFSRSALGMTGMHDWTNIAAPFRVTDQRLAAGRALDTFQIETNRDARPDCCGIWLSRRAAETDNVAVGILDVEVLGSPVRRR